MKKFNFKVPFGIFNKSDKEAFERWKHLEFAMRKPTEEEVRDFDRPQTDYRNKLNETYFKFWNTGI